MLTRYITKITLNNLAWAKATEEQLIQEADYFYKMFGAAPIINRNGKIVSIDAFIIGDIPKSEVIKHIIMIDMIMTRPFISQIF